MTHKSGRKSYPAKKGHPGKKMNKKTDEHMSEAERKKMMKRRMR